MKKRDFIQMLGAGAVGAAFSPSLVALSGCKVTNRQSAGNKLRFWADVPPNESPKKTPKSDDEWRWMLSSLKNWGVDGIVLLCRTNSIVDQVAPITREFDMTLLTWIISLEYPDPQTMKAHPDYYVVNGNGISCIDKPPYIPDYRWLCPSNPEVQEFMIKRVSDLADYENIGGVHLDYMRYPDVYLQPNIRTQYDIPQDEVIRPEYDFCYCPVCRKLFKEKEGIDPMDLPDTSTNPVWKKFRLDSITNLVNKMADVAHSKKKTLSASVFSTPTNARAMVGQDWPSWNLDFIMAMMYNYYEDKPVDWISSAIAEGVKELNGKYPLYGVLHLAHLTPEEIATAARLAINSGASGVDFFIGNMFTEYHWKCLRKEGIL